MQHFKKEGKLYKEDALNIISQATTIFSKKTLNNEILKREKQIC